MADARKKGKRQDLHLEEDTFKVAAVARSKSRSDIRAVKSSSRDEHHAVTARKEESSEEEEVSTERGYVSVTIQNGKQEELVSNDGMELVIDASRSMEIDSIFPENLISDVFLTTQPLGFGVKVLPEEGLEVALQDETLLTFTGPSQLPQDHTNFLTLRIIVIENEEIFLKIQVDSSPHPVPSAKPTAIIKGYPAMLPSLSSRELERFIKTPHLNFKLTTLPGGRALVIQRPVDGREVRFQFREASTAAPVLDCTITIPNQSWTSDWAVVTDEWLIPSFEIVEEGTTKLRGYTEVGSEHPT